MQPGFTRMQMLGVVVATGGVLCLSVTAEAHRHRLGEAGGFAALGASTITNTGPSVIHGDLGLSPGTSVTGFPPGIVHGDMHINNTAAMNAQTDALAAYTGLAGMSPTQDLTGQNLGGLTLTPGVYSFSSSAFLDGTLTLDAQGDPNAEFIFQTGSTLITGSDSFVNVVNGAEGCNVWWQVGSSATLGTDTSFVGNILADQSITMTTGAEINHGRAFALNAALTMDSNVIDAYYCIIPLPGPAAMGMAGLLGLAGVRRRRDA